LTLVVSPAWCTVARHRQLPQRPLLFTSPASSDSYDGFSAGQEVTDRKRRRYRCGISLSAFVSASLGVESPQPARFCSCITLSNICNVPAANQGTRDKTYVSTQPLNVLSKGFVILSLQMVVPSEIRRCQRSVALEWSRPVFSYTKYPYIFH